MGALTYGAREHLDVVAQLEVFDLGNATVRHNLQLPVLRAPFESWHEVLEPTGALDGEGPEVIFGNPRCSGFSCLGHGCSEDGHGAFARQTIDIQQIFQISDLLRPKPKVICFESVQQAGTVGRALLEHLVREHGDGYRIAELYHTAAQFGSAQHRKRLYVVFYREDLRLPALEITERCLYRGEHVTVGDVLHDGEHDLWNTPAVPFPYRRSRDVTLEEVLSVHPIPNHYYHALAPHDLAGILKLRQGESFNHLPEADLEDIPRLYEVRLRGASFSFGHAPSRIHTDKAAPVVMSSAHNLIHPEHNRPLTIRELCRLMGLPDDWVVIGPEPVAQIGKGVCVETARWIGALISACVTGSIAREVDEGHRWERFDLDQLSPRRPRIQVPNRYKLEGGW